MRSVFPVRVHSSFVRRGALRAMVIASLPAALVMLSGRPASAQCSSCPPGSIQEGEPTTSGCSPTDTFNGGCNSIPPIFSSISLGQTVCGTGWFDGGTRDTDWYQFTLAQPMLMHIRGTTDFDALIGFAPMPCPIATLPFYALPTGCTPASLDAELQAGSYIMFCAPQFTNLVGCDTPYTLTLTGEPVASGACCLTNGSCQIMTNSGCAAVSGIFRGDGSVCANANCPQPPYRFDCTLQATFTDISGAGGGTVIAGAAGDDVSAPFTSSVTNAIVTNPNLFVGSNGMISSSAFTTYTNTALPVAGQTLFLAVNWDDLYNDAPGSILHKATTEGGIPVHIIQWNQVRTFAANGGLRGSFECKIWGAGGPALIQYLYQDMTFDWNGNSSTIGVQAPGVSITNSFLNNNVPGGPIANNSACSIVANSVVVCYPNCDHSTSNPCLTVQDFGCFLNAFAAGDSYANCDGSTTIPVLTVQDFGCFLNSFAAGCGTNC
jgi:hypothetical protein